MMEEKGRISVAEYSYNERNMLVMLCRLCCKFVKRIEGRADGTELNEMIKLSVRRKYLTIGRKHVTVTGRKHQGQNQNIRKTKIRHGKLDENSKNDPTSSFL